jgi:hypothetical protein
LVPFLLPSLARSFWFGLRACSKRPDPSASRPGRAHDTAILKLILSAPFPVRNWQVHLPTSCAHLVKLAPWLRVVLLAAIIPLLSGWTCGVFFVSCHGVGQPQIKSISPEAIPGDAESVLLTVEGNGFTTKSQIMWNSIPLPTTRIDSHHLMTTITQETFSSFGGSVGSSVQISASSTGNLPGTGCPINGNSNVMPLVVN